MDFVRTSLQRTIKSNEHLNFIMMRDRHKDPNLVKEALDIIRGIDADSSKENINGNLEDTDNDTEFVEDRTIYDFEALKHVADGLDFQARPRMSRDGKCRCRPPLAFCCVSLQLIVVLSAKDQNIFWYMAKSIQPRW